MQEQLNATPYYEEEIDRHYSTKIPPSFIIKLELETKTYTTCQKPSGKALV